MTTNRLIRRWWAVALTSLLAGFLLGAPTKAAANGLPSFCGDGTQPYLPVENIESFSPGTEVTGLSVTSGLTPTEFSGEYVGYISDALGTNKDLLLFRLSSDVIDGTGGLKAAGIWAGMSGSPVYYDGSLIGAVAYSLNQDNLPIAGVTPAEYMKDIGNIPAFPANVQTNTNNLKVDPAQVDALAGQSFAEAPTVSVAGSAGKFANAFINRTLARTPRSANSGSFLRSGAFRPAAVQAQDAPSTPVAGGTVASLYFSGDLVAGSVGTVTAVCVDQVWAFGHPAAFLGTAQQQMAVAETALIVPDATGGGSYKQISKLLSPVGMFTQDRRFGIKGQIGQVDGFEVNLQVVNPSDTGVAAYTMKVSDPEAAASAVAGLIGKGAYENLDQYASGAGRVYWQIAYQREDQTTGTYTNSQVDSDRYLFPDVIGTPVAEDVWAITSFENENVTITSINIVLQLLSPNQVRYKVADVQVRGAGTWTSLAGSRLKAGRSYDFRPMYKQLTNGKWGRTAFAVDGQQFTVSLSRSARKSGYLTIGAPTIEAMCGTDADCPAWGQDPAAEDAEFEELLAAMQSRPNAGQVFGSLRYRLKRGGTGAYFDWLLDFPVQGSRTASFTIKR